MFTVASFRVVILPDLYPAVAHCTLAEAIAFQHGYHEVIDPDQREAVIALDGGDCRHAANWVSRAERRARPRKSPRPALSLHRA